METLKPFLIEQGYIGPEAEPDDEPGAEPDDEPGAVPDGEPGAEPESAQPTQSAKPAAPDIEMMEISVPAADMTVAALKNLINTLYTKQYLLNHAIGQEVFRISDGVVARLQEYTPESPEAFAELLNDFQALEELAGVDVRDGQVTLRFPFDAVKPDQWAIYGALTAGIVKAATGATRVIPKRQQPENEKYFMRSWLVRLGFDGPEFKDLRKLLLKNLHGHSAFRSDAEAQKHREKYAELRRDFAVQEVRS
ncbi:hypothetical protein LJC33_00255 [Eubacteriales bacterium OttesenSCG-928-N13]|nr:hypothetical protein [Eubacteriales bacterium OttesenSCG-928-N13]